MKLEYTVTISSCEDCGKKKVTPGGLPFCGHPSADEEALQQTYRSNCKTLTYSCPFVKYLHPDSKLIRD